jgi:peptidylprolyl isomerase
LFTRFASFAVLLLAFALVLGACTDDEDGTSSEPVTPTPSQSGSTPTPFAGRDPGVAFADVCQKSDVKQFSQPEPVIDPAMSYTATITTDNGDIVLELFSDVPITTNNFVFLACKGYYDGLTFHRVLPGFVAQGGDPEGTGGGGPGYTIPDESSADHKMDAGVISMAKTAAPDSAGSQFFITYTEQPDLLDMGFTVFGEVTEGTDVLEQITPRDPSTDPNAPPGDTIATITIEEQ